MAGVDVDDLIQIKNSCCRSVSILLNSWKYTVHSDEYKTEICLELKMEFMNACKRVFNDVSNKLGVSVDVNVTESVPPDLGPITFCDQYLFGLLKIMKGSGQSGEDQRKIISELRKECIDAVDRVVDKAERDEINLSVELLSAHKKLSFLASDFESYFGTAEIPRNIMSVISMRGLSLDEDIKTYMDKLNILKHGIQVLQNIKTEKMMKIKKDIQNLCEEITGSSILCDEFTEVEPTTDLFTKRFEEYQSLLDELEHDKSCRAQKVSELLTTVRDLCNVLGMDFCSIAAEVHQSLSGSTSVHSISTNTLNKLANKVLILKEEKKQRLHMLQVLAFQLNFHWNLMDTPPEERKLFDHVTCNISASADEVTLPEGALAMDLIEKAEVVVKRLDQLYASRIAFKRQAKLDLKALQKNVKAFVDSGDPETTELFVDPANLIAKKKEEKQRIEDQMDSMQSRLMNFNAQKVTPGASTSTIQPIPEFEMPAYVPAAPTGMQRNETAPELDSFEERKRRYRQINRKLIIDPSLDNIPDVTGTMKAIRYIFEDGEMLGKPGFQIYRSTPEDIAVLGRQIIPMLASGFTEQGVACLFFLAYHLRTPVRGEERYVIEEDPPGDLEDLDIRDIEQAYLISLKPTPTYPATRDPNLEAMYYAFIAASTLRLFTKSAENYVRAFTHIHDGFSKFYSLTPPVIPQQPAIDAVKTLSAHFNINPRCKTTLFRFLYMHSNPDLDHIYPEMRRFLFDMHLANTGLHSVRIFLGLCQELNCKPAAILSIFNYPEHERQVLAMIEMMRLIANKSPETQRKMWRFGRIFDDSFMAPLQTRTCPAFTYTLASALKLLKPRTNEKILDIVQLGDVGPERRRDLDFIASKIVRMVSEPL